MELNNKDISLNDLYKLINKKFDDNDTKFNEIKTEFNTKLNEIQNEIRANSYDMENRHLINAGALPYEPLRLVSKNLAI